MSTPQRYAKRNSRIHREDSSLARSSIGTLQLPDLLLAKVARRGAARSRPAANTTDRLVRRARRLLNNWVSVPGLVVLGSGRLVHAG